MSKSLNSSALGPKRITQYLLGAAVLVLVAGGLVLFLMNSQIRDMQATVSDKESKVGSNEQIAKRYQQTLTDYNTTQAHMQFLEASVSAKSFVPTLLKQLQALATQTHLTVTAVRPGAISAPVSATPAPAPADAGGTDATVKKAPPPPYDTLDIAVDVTGSYPDTATFLYGLTRFPKIVSVASAQMHPGGADAKSAVPQLTTNLHLTAFVFHGDKDSPAVVTAVASGPLPASPATGGNTSMVSDAAHNAASRSVGASKAAQARSEVGVQTL